MEGSGERWMEIVVREEEVDEERGRWMETGEGVKWWEIVIVESEK